MFLYWRKRGVYELEALPGHLAELELGAERFSWSSTLDVIEDLGGRWGSRPRRTSKRLWQSLWPELPPAHHAQVAGLVRARAPPDSCCRGERAQREAPGQRAVGAAKELSLLQVV